VDDDELGNAEEWKGDAIHLVDAAADHEIARYAQQHDCVETEIEEAVVKDVEEATKGRVQQCATGEEK
jgi:hypothetical protein